MSALSEFGHLLETFVVVEVLEQAGWLEGIARVGHWRSYDGDEVDLVVEHADEQLLVLPIDRLWTPTNPRSRRS